MSEDIDGDRTVYNQGVSYQCPRCGASTTFDVEKKTSRTSLAEKFDRVMGTLPPYEQDYCDFDCSGCGVPVRCVYAFSEVSMNHYQNYPKTFYGGEPSDIPVGETEETPSGKKSGCIYLVVGIGGLIVALLALLSGIPREIEAL